jgi:hypothetical protein
MTSGRSAVRASGLLTAIIAAISFVGCANDKIVFRDRQPFNNPPAAALGFLGYYDAQQSKQPAATVTQKFREAGKRRSTPAHGPT